MHFPVQDVHQTGWVSTQAEFEQAIQMILEDQL